MCLATHTNSSKDPYVLPTSCKGHYQAQDIRLWSRFVRMSGGKRGICQDIFKILPKEMVSLMTYWQKARYHRSFGKNQTKERKSILSTNITPTQTLKPRTFFVPYSFLVCVMLIKEHTTVCNWIKCPNKCV